LDGAHTIYVRAKDDDNDYSTNYSDGFTIDATPPTLTSITISDSSGYTTSQTPSISIVSSGSPSHIAFSCNGGSNYSSWISYESPITSFNITNGATGCVGTNGSKTITAKLKDTLGNESTTTSDTTYYDTTGPSTPGIPSTTSPTTDATPTWNFTASTDDGAGLASPPYTIQWCMDSGYTGCSSNTATSPTNSYTHSVTLSTGTWYARVQAQDVLGNPSSWTGNGTVDITSPSNVSPTISLGSVTPDPTSDTTPLISGTALDSDGTISTVEYQVDSTAGSWSACTPDDGTFNGASETFTCTSAVLLDGAHTIYVRAKDDDNDYSTNYSDGFTVTVATGGDSNYKRNRPSHDPKSNPDDKISGTITLTKINDNALQSPLTEISGAWKYYISKKTKPSFYGTGSPNGLYVRVSVWPNTQICQTHVIGGAWWCESNQDLSTGTHRIDVQYGSKLLPPFNLSIAPGYTALNNLNTTSSLTRAIGVTSSLPSGSSNFAPVTNNIKSSPALPILNSNSQTSVTSASQNNEETIFGKILKGSVKGASSTGRNNVTGALVIAGLCGIITMIITNIVIRKK
jgi:hypothetical protein